ncbi:MAG: stage 0 sporulation family protein [Spirochaetales bacterium]|nr:stage 0 sporulation family protein [Spirochaetales bacterium]
MEQQQNTGTEPEPQTRIEPEGREAGVFRVRIVHCSSTELYSAPEGLPLRRGDFVVVNTRYGTELGCVQGPVRAEAPKDLQAVLRKATQRDMECYQSNREREEKAFRICREKIAEHGLDMKLISAHYLLEEAKILFYFSAESRVDFRELVRDLVAVFKKRIELRQIGVRDESRVIGGMGICGRTFCCHGITDKLRAVSIKMAKEQNLTLNSMKISGPCGRLLCCLSYEYETYREVRRSLPQEGARLNIEGRTYRVVDINVFLRQVRLDGEDGSSLFVGFQSFVHDPEGHHWSVTVP